MLESFFDNSNLCKARVEYSKDRALNGSSLSKTGALQTFELIQGSSTQRLELFKTQACKDSSIPRFECSKVRASKGPSIQRLEYSNTLAFQRVEYSKTRVVKDSRIQTSELLEVSIIRSLEYSQTRVFSDPPELLRDSSFSKTRDCRRFEYSNSSRANYRVFEDSSL